jgi:hypothetical protein
MTGKICALMFLGFTALAVSVGGCGGGDCANSLYVTWSIDDGVNPLQCADVGAQWVDVTAAGVVSEFPCEAHSGRTFREPAGDYPVDVQLLTPARTVLSDANDVFSVPACGGVSLPNVAFLVN